MIENMIRDYNNEQVVKLFGKQIEKIGERKAEVLKGKVKYAELSMDIIATPPDRCFFTSISGILICFLAVSIGSLEQRAKMQQHIENFRAQNKEIHQQLDQAIEQLEDRFTDTANVVEYDSARLEKQYLDGKGLEKSRDRIPCFTERANIASCYENKREPPVCEVFITALSNCANKIITQE